MAKKSISIILYIILISGCAYLPSTTLQSPGIGIIEPIKKTDRVLILAPHPDDEAIGCAGIIQEAVSKGADIKIVYLTNGDHNQFAFIVYEKRLTLRKGEFIHMGEVRKSEAIKAMKLLGVDSSNLIFLGYPDSGTFTIFREVWQERKPYKSMLTRISKVPYKENFSFGAPYKGESILADLEKILKEYKPNKIFVSHPADANADHKALYLFLQVALRDLKKEIPQPRIYPYLVHCIGWPLPRHYRPQLDLNAPEQFLGSPVDWFKFNLALEQLNKKHQAILCYRSQTSSSAFYLLAFARRNELFSDYPEVELKKEEPVKDQPVWNAASNLARGGCRASYGLSGENLLIRIDKPRELNKRFSTQLYLFGYSDRTPFAAMPKIRIITKHKRFKVFAARKIVKSKGISLKLGPKELIISVPLEVLGEPDFILTAVKTYAGILHTDTTSFRKITIK